MTKRQPRKIRVAQIITSCVLGGGGSVMSAIARNIDKSKFELDIYCVIEGGELVEGIRDLGVNVRILPILDRSRAFAYDYKRWWELASCLRHGRYDIVHTHLFQADLIGRIAALIARRRVIVKTLHNMGAWKRIQHRVYDRILNAFTSKVICVSDAQRRAVVKQEHLAGEKVVTIRNGADIARFGKTSDKEALARELGLDLGKPIVGTVGRLIEEKGQRYLLEAAPRILKEFPGAQFLIVGDGPLRGELEALARIRAPDSVCITGLRPDVPSLLSLMDIFVFPSVSEAFGIAVTEAMASQCPVACSDNLVLGEIISDGETGLIFRQRDAESLASSVCSLLGSEELRIGLAARAYKVVQEQFSEAAMVRAHERLYISLL